MSGISHVKTPLLLQQFGSGVSIFFWETFHTFSIEQDSQRNKRAGWSTRQRLVLPPLAKSGNAYIHSIKPLYLFLQRALGSGPMALHCSACVCAYALLTGFQRKFTTLIKIFFSQAPPTSKVLVFFPDPLRDIHPVNLNLTLRV